MKWVADGNLSEPFTATRANAVGSDCLQSFQGWFWINT
jgi:hypothetical protein